MDQWLRNPNVVRIIALVIAVLLWLVVHMDERSGTGAGAGGANEQIISNVEVKAIYDESKYHLVSVEPAQVSVALSGRESSVKRAISSGEFSIQVDMTGSGKGEHINQPLKAVGFPAGVTARVMPLSVKVVLDEKQNKSMPVTVLVTGEPTSGLMAGTPIAKPGRVTVTVPSTYYDDVETVSAEISIEQASQAVIDNVTLGAYDKDGKKLDFAVISPPVVEVEVPITSPFVQVPLQLGYTGKPPQGYAVAALTQDPNQVTVYGSQAILDEIDFYDGPHVDLSNLTSNKEFTLDIPVRNGLELKPGQVKVKVEIVPSVTKTLTDIRTEFMGQNASFNTTVIEPAGGRLDLLVEGAPDTINKLRTQDIQAVVDVSNLPPGVHELEVDFILPTFVKEVEGQSQKVTVEIKEKGLVEAASVSPPSGQQTASEPPQSKAQEDTPAVEEQGETVPDADPGEVSAADKEPVPDKPPSSEPAVKDNS